MDTPEKVKRPWWRKKRWWAMIALWLCLPLYPLAGGPGTYCVVRRWCPPDPFHEYLHIPVQRRLRLLGLQDEYTDYCDWWFTLANRHAAAQAASATQPAHGGRSR